MQNGHIYVNPSGSKNSADVCLDVLLSSALAIKKFMARERICLCVELEEVMGLRPGTMNKCTCFRRTFNRLRDSLVHGPGGLPTALGELLQWRSDVVSWVPISTKFPLYRLIRRVY